MPKRLPPKTFKTKEDLQAALPDVSTTLGLKGLDAIVEVYRDRYGIPHVKAQSVHDAFWGQGFATAQDRLWHMDYDRRRAYGRWAEYAGKAAIEQDKMMRRFQIELSVKSDYRAVNAETKAMLDAYSAGVNAFIKTTDSLPVEYSLVGSEAELWQPWDCLAVFKVRHILMGVFESKLWRARLLNSLGPERTTQLLRGYPLGHLLIVPPGVEYSGPILDGFKELSEGLEALSWLKDYDSGSNNWVLAGRRTYSGKPLLAGDPHRFLDTPNVYYQNHIACPNFDVIGLSFPGCPGFPHFGHNAYVAWCVTHAGADYQDLYIEKFKPSDPTKYEFKGRWEQAHLRPEAIKVREERPIEMVVTSTHHGPIIAGNPEKDYGIAFKYTATAGPNQGAESILRMLKATSADELEESMREWVDPCNNLLFADIYGNVGYLNRGKVPIRSRANAWLPVPGWTGEHEWEGFIPFEELVRMRNPDTGYIVTANNRIVGEEYPYYIALDYAPDYRARRIIDRLKPLKEATVQDMASIHSEKVSIPAQSYARLVSEIDPIDEASMAAKERLAGWDGTMDRDTVAPTVYSAFRLRLHRVILEHLLGVSLAHEAFDAMGRGVHSHFRQLSALLVTTVNENDTSLLPSGHNWKTLAAQALADGLSDLREILGNEMDSWHWGRVHFTRPEHTLSAAYSRMATLLDPPSFPTGGDGDTPHASGYLWGDPYVVTGTSVARYVFDLADWDNSQWIVPLGASGHPGSPHYADQAPIWAEVKLVPMKYEWSQIASAAESHQKLVPRGIF